MHILPLEILPLEILPLEILPLEILLTENLTFKKKYQGAKTATHHKNLIVTEMLHALIFLILYEIICSYFFLIMKLCNITHNPKILKYSIIQLSEIEFGRK